MANQIRSGLYMAAMILLLLMGCGKSSSSGGYGGGNNNSGGNTTPNTVNMSGMSFSVALLTVTAGTTVTWKNNDSYTHTVTADDGSFDSGDIAGGASYTHTFSTAGTYPYHCNYHAGMKASIKVNN